MPSPEELALQNIGALLIEDRRSINHASGHGVANSENLQKGGDEADYKVRLSEKDAGRALIAINLQHAIRVHQSILNRAFCGMLH